MTTKQKTEHRWYQRTVSVLVLAIGLLTVQLVGALAADTARQAALPSDSIAVGEMLGKDSPNYAGLLSNRQTVQLTLRYLNEVAGAALENEEIPYVDLNLLTAVAEALTPEIAIDHFLIEGAAVTIVGSANTKQEAEDFAARLTGSSAVLSLEWDGNADEERGLYHFSLLCNQSE